MSVAEVEFEGKLLVITAPSGAGKTTIVRHLLKKYNHNLAFSVSATTRDKRAHEVDGRDYYFLSTERFREKIANEKFLEWEEVYEGQYYGTLISEVDRIWSDGHHVVFDIEVKGAANIKRRYGDRALVIFIRPPSMDILIERLEARQTESSRSMERRISRMREEMTYESSFDLVLVNDDLQVALEEAEYIAESFINNESYGQVGK